MIDTCDVVVVGGGPAGAATAIALARAGRDVVVLEQSLFDGERIGETLPPEARVPLAALEVWDRFVAQRHEPSPASISAWEHDAIDENHFVFNAYGHGWHLDRARFDAMLRSAAVDCGARLYRGARLTACVADAAGTEAGYLRAGAVRTIRARFIVDATGRASIVARRQGARRMRFDRLVAAVGMFSPSTAAAARDCRTLVEAACDGWWYSAWLPQSRLIAAYMTDGDLLQESADDVDAVWRRQLGKTVHTRLRLNDVVARGPLRIVSACSDRLTPIAGHTWAAIGDAAMSVDPLSSQGISWALKSGLIAARAIEGHLDGDPAAIDELSTWTSGLFDRYWRTHALHYSRVQRWPESPFWRRRTPGNEVQTRVAAAGTFAQVAVSARAPDPRARD